MAHNNDQCIAREYLNFEYSCRLEERWLCKQCYRERQIWNAQKKNNYRNHEDAAKIIEMDLQKFKINRQCLLQHLHQLFNKYPISTNHKIQFAQEISQINALFLDMINNPFNEQELRKLDDILNTIRDISRFKELTEFEIKQILSIGRGHYQCDNSKVQQILNIMMNIDELKSSNLFVYLKLINNLSKEKLCYSQPYDQLRCVDQISISNNKLFSTTFLVIPLEDDTYFINAIKNINNKPQNFFQLQLKHRPRLLNQSKGIIFGSILIIQQQSIPVCDNKTYILSIKSQKIIRSFKNRYETIQYDQSNNQFVGFKNLILYFYDLSTLKLKNQIKVYEQLENISFVSSTQRLFSLNNQQLAVFDIDQQRIINRQKIYYQEIQNYLINQQCNIIVLLFKNKIVILDFNFTQLKCIDWSTQQLSLFQTQVSEDMKYLYSKVSGGRQLQIFKKSLAN